MPDFFKYFIDTQLVPAHCGLVLKLNSSCTMFEVGDLGSLEALQQRLFRAVKAPYSLTLLKCKAQASFNLSPYTPLWNNPYLTHLLMIPNTHCWAKFNIKTLLMGN